MYKEYTSTSSFQDIDPYDKNSNLYIGGNLEAIRIEINNYNPNSITALYCTIGGPGYFVILAKLNNNYFAGFIWSYSLDTTLNTPWFFTNIDETRYLRPIMATF